MNDELKLGTRGKPYVVIDGDKTVIMVDEVRYDAGYDTYYKTDTVINFHPTPTEIFKVKLTNPNSKVL